MNTDKFLFYLDSFDNNIDQKRSIIRLMAAIAREYGGGGGAGGNQPCILLENAEDYNVYEDNENGKDYMLDSYTFKISKLKEDNDVNLLLAADILFNKVVSVNIIGTLNGIEYNTIGIYNNGYITAIQRDMQIIFNVNFNTGEITIDKLYKLNEFMPHIHLEIGNSDEIKAYNLEHLKDGHFYVQVDYGYGAGTFQPTQGGFIHITTAYGDDTFFKINIDGSIEADRDYLKPNEPYSVQLTSDQIGVELDEITASKVYKAGELIIDGPTGLVTFTRTSDSIKSAVYFTDSKKDGTMTVLTYIVNTKTITSA